jgi:hypothetical protein
VKETGTWTNCCSLVLPACVHYCLVLIHLPELAALLQLLTFVPGSLVLAPVETMVRACQRDSPTALSVVPFPFPGVSATLVQSEILSIAAACHLPSHFANSSVLYGHVCHPMARSWPCDKGHPEGCLSAETMCGISWAYSWDQVKSVCHVGPLHAFPA